MADVEHFEPTERREAHRRDPEVQREGSDTTQAAFQSPYAQDVDDATAGGPPAHPTPDGGGTGVGGVVSQQAQDTGANFFGANSNAVSQQTQDTGANFFGANSNAPPLQLANDSENLQRTLQRRAKRTRYLALQGSADRMRQSIADKRDSDDLRGHFTEEDDSHYKALDRRWEYREWCATRWGYLTPSAQKGQKKTCSYYFFARGTKHYAQLKSKKKI
jgi:hypothetical protein